LTVSIRSISFYIKNLISPGNSQREARDALGSHLFRNEFIYRSRVEYGLPGRVAPAIQQQNEQGSQQEKPTIFHNSF
jgi:hypothetical protein